MTNEIFPHLFSRPSLQIGLLIKIVTGIDLVDSQSQYFISSVLMYFLSFSRCAYECCNFSFVKDLQICPTKTDEKPFYEGKWGWFEHTLI